ncbi:trehalose-phosphatase [Natrarchaeobius halalkaliphilus]|uniref:Trehalose 6-phosphate phosphatase n=1 Tax=Natrarchaeobius halalkaliphilus TaxID=1679091 RepID=A0A3N6LQ47_9EURY|nr:trehalose-phosphatase [Natrarchaeobius halalkaliphilus]RQG91698.1 trehalose-phosphatase [Natrarchaeobius halalkaliphilus]
MSETPPSRLEEHLPQIRRTLAGGSGLLVCLDFDGTLAPIVDDPEEATPLRENEAAVDRLSSHPAVSTAIVSGRGLPDVRDRVGGLDAYAGNHGLEFVRNGSVAVHPVARKRAVLVDQVCSALETVLEPVPSSRIENKRLTGTVHTRTVPAPLRPLVRRLTKSIVDRIGGDQLEVSSGRRVLEIGPSIPWGKGNAVELLSAELPRDTVAVYVGDDVTDESAFNTVEPNGVGVRVGGDRPSAASYRVTSPADVAAFLTWLESVGLEELDRSPGLVPTEPERPVERTTASDRRLGLSSETADD